MFHAVSPIQLHSVSLSIWLSGAGSNPYDRHQEISLWIKNNKFEGDWIAIDDLPMPQLGAHFVQTNPTTGLVDSDVAKAVMQLSSR